MKKTPKKNQHAGFALIVTLSLMILLTVIAVGLLSLSSISLRATSQASATSVARSNARLAMMLALGELQAAMGPDKSVSAPASAVISTAPRPHLTGAWNATDPADYWRWTPVAGGSPSYSSKSNAFSRWLVSTPTPADAATFDFASSPEPTGTDAVTLVGDPSKPLKNSDNLSTTVAASKVRLANPKQPGKYGWAVFDESTKASIDLGDPATKQAPGIEIASRTVPHRLRADALDKTALFSLEKPMNLVSLETASVPGITNRDDFRRRFHDFTTGTMGLLTDTANGGLKTDLTSLFEPDVLPSGAFTAPTLVSPYRDSFSVASGAPKWSYIRDHYRKYKNTTTASTGEVSYAVNSNKVTDLKINSAGLSTSPDNERLIPVIAKFQLVFSLVCHYNHIGDRVSFYNSNGGNTSFGAVHLAYDPVITLYNPYDVTLSLSKTRIRVWDPPVGFKFTKISSENGAQPFRAGGEFLGLARYQIANQSNSSARKCFTLILTDGTTEAAGNSLKLKPGEVKVFSPRVQKTWDWAWETAGGYDPKAFFDYNQGLEFGNMDFRTKNAYGIETVPGWEPRAGLQTDHLATSNPRYDPSRYQFERAANRNDGFVNVRVNDQVMVEAKPLVTSASATKQFQVDILAGNTPGTPSFDNTNTGVKADTLRTYSFTFSGADPAAEISANPSNPIIKQQFMVKNMLQTPTDKTSEFKKPFAMLEMSARTTKDALTDSKPWLYNNPVTEGGDQNSNQVGLSHQSYDLRFTEMASFKSFPTGIAIDDANHGYFGASDSITDGGSSFVSMMHVPVAPAASLGEFIPSNLASGSVLPRVTHPFGNSRAHPLIPADKVTQTLGTVMMDHSYLLNDALWDTYFFSSIAPYTGGSGQVLPTSRKIEEVLTGVLDGTQPALNSRLIPTTQSDPKAQTDKVMALTDVERSRQLAKYVGVKGPFNVNSTSADAWKSVLFSLRDREINGLQPSTSGAAPNKTTNVSSTSFSNNGTTPFVRMSKPLAGSNPPAELLWAGFRALTDKQIDDLAKQIVIEIKAAGVEDSAPPLSLAEFVNRRPSASGVHRLAGLLQTAIDRSGINKESIDRDSKALSAASIPAKRKTGVRTSEVMDGNSAEGAPSMLTQGDLMMALAPVATVRGDTFKIRSYGEATAANGTTVLARAWCETIVQRVPDFVDSTELAETPVASLASAANRNFGRRFNVVSFRWLNESEL